MTDGSEVGRRDGVDAAGHPVAPVGGDLGDPVAVDVLAALADYRTLALEREGIGMFLALYDARPGHDLHVTDEAAQAEGRRLAKLFDGYWQQLEAAGFPSDDPDPDETGARELIDAVVVLSDVHLVLRPRSTWPTSDQGADGA